MPCKRADTYPSDELIDRVMKMPKASDTNSQLLCFLFVVFSLKLLRPLLVTEQSHVDSKVTVKIDLRASSSMQARLENLQLGKLPSTALSLKLYQIVLSDDPQDLSWWRTQTHRREEEAAALA